MVKSLKILKYSAHANISEKSLILLNIKALKADLKTLVLFLKNPIKKKEEMPRHSQKNKRRTQFLDNTNSSILNIKKFNCFKNLSLCKKKER
jgi:hypothetical protein